MPFSHVGMKWQIISTVVLILTAACTPAGPASDTEQLMTERISTSTAVPVVQALPTVAVISTPEALPESTLTIWWPEPLAPVGNVETADMLANYVAAFQATQSNVRVVIRLKQPGNEAGAILPTLRTASAVAPDALPDLTLLRLDELLEAHQNGLIYPLEDRIASAVLDDLYRVALELGQIDEQLHALPFLIDLQHLAYHSDTGDVSWQFEDMLGDQRGFAFPAGQSEGLNSVFWVQYLAAGGGWPPGTNASSDRVALLEILEFYERATALGIVDQSLLSYSSVADYQDDLAEGLLRAGVVTSGIYLKWVDEGLSLRFAPIPTASGAAISAADSWMWVLTTTDAEQEMLALRFLDWMMEANRQGQYSQAVRLLPSRHAAFRQWPGTAYTRVLEALLANATSPLSEDTAGSAARALQTAFTSVLMGQSSAQKAVETALSQIES